AVFRGCVQRLQRAYSARVFQHLVSRATGFDLEAFLEVCSRLVQRSR
ncbi:hypothetical protein A2U01_0104065, partial [Trifolium medium]|nr:hypothetical protein [Trifolium medium]